MRGFRRWQDWISLVLAVWISVSPAVFPLASGATVLIAAGIALALLALVTLVSPFSMVQEIIRLLMAALTFSMPWIFGFAGGAALNLRIASLALFALTAGSLATILRWRTYCRDASDAVRRQVRTS